MSFESYYTKNPILAKAQARKLHRHLKTTAIKILQEEMKQSPNSRKQTWRMAIRAIKEKL